MFKLIDMDTAFLVRYAYTGGIQIPTLYLQPHDDPAFSDKTRDIVPLSALETNENILYVETEKGGHFGYVEVRMTKRFVRVFFICELLYYCCYQNY